MSNEQLISDNVISVFRKSFFFVIFRIEFSVGTGLRYLLRLKNTTDWKWAKISQIKVKISQHSQGVPKNVPI